MKKLFSVILIAIMAMTSLTAQKALVIGNGSMGERSSSRPYQDASLVDLTLTQMGWDVQRHDDLDAKSFKPQISKFAASIQDQEPVLIFFSGSAIQIEGGNYLVPIGTFASEKEFKDAAPELNWVLSQVEKATIKMLFLDAARTPKNLQFKQKYQGLGAIEKVAANTLVMYGAALNTIVPDDPGKNNHLAVALEQQLKLKELDLSTLMPKIQEQMAILDGGKTPPKPYGTSTIAE